MIGIGLYGDNGHQLAAQMSLVGAHVVAVCGVDAAPAHLTRYAVLADMLADPTVQLVAICAPWRVTQGVAIRQALAAGKHVLAEKPLVMHDAELIELMALATRHGCQLFDMAGIADESPYVAIRTLVSLGRLGQIGQIVVRKSYPYAPWRPQDEAVDGGLIMQSGIHAVRLIEHCAGQRITYVSALSTQLGNPVVAGGLQMAATMHARLAGGGIASVVLNYYNPYGTQRWGDDALRIYGTAAMITTDDQGDVYLIADGTTTPISGAVEPSYIQRVVDCVRGVAPRPRPMAIDLHPTQVVIAAHASATQAGAWLAVPDFHI